MPEIGLFGSEGGVPITGIPTPIIALRSFERCLKRRPSRTHGIDTPAYGRGRFSFLFSSSRFHSDTPHVSPKRQYADPMTHSPPRVVFFVGNFWLLS